ncbi:MAG: alpha-L-arabinofuranosidase [Verrucomicrobia bacterium]|nr:alpha-L-arabinofuranosidase [Verrucomicrobiota bacterium]
MAETSAMKAKTITVNPAAGHEISPYLFMQFMEPLGDTDSSVEAAWNWHKQEWREDVIAVTKELKPGLIRWPGGILTSFYRWKEAVGPRAKRVPMHNIMWSGMESNQIGTHEFISFCRQTGADPLLAVNFECDGYDAWRRDWMGRPRCAGPKEAAEWVDYCNNPKNRKRIANGAKVPFDVRLWQIGNETSYGKDGFDCETSAKRTVAFAKAMHKADPDIGLIAWGDSGWAPRVIEVAGEHIQYLAFHHHWGSQPQFAPLHQDEYRKDGAATWAALMAVPALMEQKLDEMRKDIAGSHVKLAMTEGHFAVPGRHRGDVLSSWAVGVSDARVLNVQIRNGDILKISTLADFCGSRWGVNAIMIPIPWWNGPAFMMPVARVMSLYRRHIGKRICDVQAPAGLDTIASRTGKTVYVHVVNTDRTRPADATFRVDGHTVGSGKVWQIADDPAREIWEGKTGVFAPTEHTLPANSTWTFPPASVSAVELKIKS